MSAPAPVGAPLAPAVDDTLGRRQRRRAQRGVAQRARRRRLGALAAAVLLPWLALACRGVATRHLDRRLDMIAIALPPLAMAVTGLAAGCSLLFTWVAWRRAARWSYETNLVRLWQRGEGRLRRQAPMYFALSTVAATAVATIGPWRATGGPAPVAGTTFEIDTINIAHRSTGEVQAALARRDPDVLVVQELSEPLYDELAARFPYHAATALVFERSHDERSTRNNRASVGIFSRLPLHELTTPDGMVEGLPGLRVALDTPSGTVVLYGLHLPKPAPLDDGFSTTFAEQAAVVHAVLDAVEREQDPVVVAGDLNVSDRQALYGELTGPLHDAVRQQGWAGSTSAKDSLRWRLLLLRIDHVLISDGLCAGPAGRFTVPAADHRGVGAVIGSCPTA